MATDPRVVRSSAVATPVARDRAAANRRLIRTAMLVLTLIGLAVATYLTIAHYAGIAVLCTTKHNSCEQVQTSVYSKVAGVPVALLGLIGYVAILATLLAPEREATRLATLAVTVFGFGFSDYLTYREVFTLQAICEWCISSAIIMTLLLGLAVTRYLSGDPA